MINGFRTVLQDVRPADLWDVIYDQLSYVIGLIVLAGLLSYLCLSFVTPSYTASSRVLINQKTSSQTASANASFLAQQMTLMRSDQMTVLPMQHYMEQQGNLNQTFYPVESKKHLASFKQNLEVFADKNENIVTLQFTSQNPVQAARVVNGIVQNYVGLWQGHLLRNSRINPDYVLKSGVPVRIKVIEEAAIPSSASFPKKGPMALLVMALVGLLCVVILSIRETVAFSAKKAKRKFQYLEKEENYEGAKPLSFQKNLMHILDGYAKRTALIEQMRTSFETDSDSVNSILGKLGNYQHKNEAFCLMVSGENMRTHAAPEALATARALAKEGLAQGSSTLLIDMFDDKDNVSTLLQLYGKPGFYDILDNPALIGTALHADMLSPLHVISCGQMSAQHLSAEQTENLKQVFKAWCAVYKNVVLNVRADIAPHLYENLSDVLSTGLFIQQGHRPAADAISFMFADIANHFRVIMHQRNPTYDFYSEPVAMKSSSLYN